MTPQAARLIEEGKDKIKAGIHNMRLRADEIEQDPSAGTSVQAEELRREIDQLEQWVELFPL